MLQIKKKKNLGVFLNLRSALTHFCSFLSLPSNFASVLLTRTSFSLTASTKKGDPFVSCTDPGVPPEFPCPEPSVTSLSLCTDGVTLWFWSVFVLSDLVFYGHMQHRTLHALETSTLFPSAIGYEDIGSQGNPGWKGTWGMSAVQPRTKRDRPSCSAFAPDAFWNSPWAETAELQWVTWH